MRSPHLRALHLVVPADVDEPAAVSGGNRYDRRLADALAERGCVVHEHVSPDTVPDGATALVDGLVAQADPAPVVAASARVRVWLLAHMVFGTPGEAAALAAAHGVVATSAWTRDHLVATYAVDPARVLVARPGVDPAPPTVPSPAGDRLLCVGALVPGKGQDLLLDALADVPGRWRLTCVGSTVRDPRYAAALRRIPAARRVRFPGVLTGADLAAAYADADLLVHPSRSEGYGMVLTEALARGVPVLAGDVGGVREALGSAGTLVRPDDRDALAGALTAWLGDPALRDRQRAAASVRRGELRGRASGWTSGWAGTADAVLAAIDAPSEVPA